MKVIKLGGSLLNDVDSLANCLNTIEHNAKEKIVIVPGGGIFADQVRLAQLQWDFDDITAHHMAVLAMQQMALLLKSHKPQFVLADNKADIGNTDAVIIWSPEIQWLNDAGVKASWDITSDSLAAWLANQFPIDELILIKSAIIPVKYTIQQMQQQGIVDKAFNQFTETAQYKITLINKHGFNEYAFN